MVTRAKILQEGRVISEGSRARVYLLDGSAFKIYKEDVVRPASIYYEAAVLARVHELGLGVAQMRGVLDDGAGQPVICLEHLSGETVFERIMRDPSLAEPDLQKLIDFQIGLHKRDAPLWSTQKERIWLYILDVGELTSAARAKLLLYLERLPRGNRLCHGNLHGNHFLLGGDEEKQMALGWLDASLGCPEGDACQSYLWFHLRNREIADTYLRLYTQTTRVCPEDVLCWLPPLAAARLGRQIAQEREALLRILGPYF